MRLVTTVSFSVLFNGGRLESFKPTRGIRQGDPISPYLFLLEAEGLSCLLKAKVQSSNLSGIKVAPSTPVVSHLLFAKGCSNSVCFSRQIWSVWMKAVLQQYCRALGQQVNRDKSSIHSAKGCSNSVWEEVMIRLDVHNMVLSEKYLRMPTDVGSAPNVAFKYLNDRVWKMIHGWMEQVLSTGGKELLIKSVAQAIPTYLMACLSWGLCQHRDGLL